MADPALIVPYVWIGDFVRCHTVVKLLRARAPDREVDILASTLCAPLADYMPGVRKAIVWDSARRRIEFGRRRALAETLRREHYGQALIMLRTWKSALAPFLARVPVRTGFLGELRLGLINDLRRGERGYPRMIDQMGALALPKDEPFPAQWPSPELVVPEAEVAAWRQSQGMNDRKRPVLALAPGAVGRGKAWPVEHYAALARELAKDGVAIWVVGGPNEAVAAAQIAQAGGANVRDLTGHDLRNAVVALAAADAAVTNDSGLMHVAAAIGTPTVAIFGPTSAEHWKPLNPLATILEPPTDPATAKTIRVQGNPAARHRRAGDVPVEDAAQAARAALARPRGNA